MRSTSWFFFVQGVTCCALRVANATVSHMKLRGWPFPEPPRRGLDPSAFNPLERYRGPKIGPSPVATNRHDTRKEQKPPQWFNPNWPREGAGGGDRPARYRSDLVNRDIRQKASGVTGERFDPHGDVSGPRRTEPSTAGSDRKPWEWFHPASVGSNGRPMVWAPGDHPDRATNHRPSGVWGKPFTED